MGDCNPPACYYTDGSFDGTRKLVGLPDMCRFNTDELGDKEVLACMLGTGDAALKTN